MEIYEYVVGHITKMAAKPINGEIPSKIFFSGFGGPISTKLQPRIVGSNNDPGFSLTYFTARSKCVT